MKKSKKRSSTQMKKYTDDEIEYLQERIGAVPIPTLVRAFCKMHYKHKEFLKRTPHAVEQKIYKLIRAEKITTCLEDNFSITEIAEILGIKNHEVRSWVNWYGLPKRKISALRTCIKRKDLKGLALKKPILFKHIDQTRLEWLMESVELADSIKNTPAIGRKGKKRRVLRLADGSIFPSASDAAAVAYIDRKHLTERINRGLPCSGSLWKFLD